LVKAYYFTTADVLLPTGAARLPCRSSANVIDQKSYALAGGMIQPEHALENILSLSNLLSRQRHNPNPFMQRRNGRLSIRPREADHQSLCRRTIRRSELPLRNAPPAWANGRKQRCQGVRELRTGGVVVPSIGFYVCRSHRPRELCGTVDGSAQSPILLLFLHSPATERGGAF
jgi:hypothetical protein